MKKILVCVLSAFFLVTGSAVLFAAETAAPAAGTSEAPAAPKKASKAGDPMVDFALPGIDGKPLKLSELAGKKATVVVFAQSACSACRSEADQLVEIMKKKKDVSLVYVMVDYTGLRGAKAFLDEYQVDKAGTVLFDPKFEVGPSYEIYSTPATIVFDADKNVMKINRGFNPRGDEIIKVISGL